MTEWAEGKERRPKRRRERRRGRGIEGGRENFGLGRERERTLGWAWPKGGRGINFRFFLFNKLC